MPSGDPVWWLCLWLCLWSAHVCGGQDLGEKLKDFDKSTSTVAAKDDKLRTTTRPFCWSGEFFVESLMRLITQGVGSKSAGGW